MRTIQKILGYAPFGEINRDILATMGLYNGTGNDKINFDDLLQVIIQKLGKVYHYNKNKQFYDDIQELVLRHDLDYFLKIGKLKADWRLTKGIFLLSHWMPLKIRLFFATVVFFSLQSKEAFKTYRD